MLLAGQGCQQHQRPGCAFLHAGDFCIKKPNQLLGQEVLLEYLQLSIDPELAHRLQQWHDRLKHERPHALLFILCTQQHVDLAGIRGANSAKQGVHCFIQLL